MKKQEIRIVRHAPIFQSSAGRLPTPLSVTSAFNFSRGVGFSLISSFTSNLFTPWRPRW